MARRCDLTGVGPQTGHKVSHSNIKTLVRFLPNLQEVSLTSDVLGKVIRLRLTAATLRSVEKNGGLDGFVLSRSAKQLSCKGKDLKRQIQKKLKEAKAA